jgi:hypothetical protein
MAMALEELVRQTLAEGHADPQVAVDPWAIVRLGRRRRRRRVGLLLATSTAAVLILGVLALGWIAQPNASTSRTRPAAGSSDEPAVVVAYEQAQRSWVGCLRSHGVDVTDPPERWPYSRLDAQLHRLKGTPVYEAAQAACSSLLPLVTPDLERAWGQAPVSVP